MRFVAVIVALIATLMPVYTFAERVVATLDLQGRTNITFDENTMTESISNGDLTLTFTDPASTKLKYSENGLRLKQGSTIKIKGIEGVTLRQVMFFSKYGEIIFDDYNSGIHEDTDTYYCNAHDLSSQSITFTLNTESKYGSYISSIEVTYDRPDASTPQQEADASTDDLGELLSGLDEGTGVVIDNAIIAFDPSDEKYKIVTFGPTGDISNTFTLEAGTGVEMPASGAVKKITGTVSNGELLLSKIEDTAKETDDDYPYIVPTPKLKSQAGVNGGAATISFDNDFGDNVRTYYTIDGSEPEIKTVVTSQAYRAPAFEGTRLYTEPFQVDGKDSYTVKAMSVMDSSKLGAEAWRSSQVLSNEISNSQTTTNIIETTTDTATIEYYSLSGIRVSNPKSAGIYIVRISGEVRKIVIN